MSRRPSSIGAGSDTLGSTHRFYGIDAAEARRVDVFGYLHHLDAMEDPAHPSSPRELSNVVDPRNMVYSWATDKHDPTEMRAGGRSASSGSLCLTCHGKSGRRLALYGGCGDPGAFER